MMTILTACVLLNGRRRIKEHCFASASEAHRCGHNLVCTRKYTFIFIKRSDSSVQEIKPPDCAEFSRVLGVSPIKPGGSRVENSPGIE